MSDRALIMFLEQKKLQVAILQDHFQNIINPLRRVAELGIDARVYFRAASSRELVMMVWSADNRMQLTITLKLFAEGDLNSGCIVEAASLYSAVRLMHDKHAAMISIGELGLMVEAAHCHFFVESIPASLPAVLSSDIKQQINSQPLNILHQLLTDGVAQMYIYHGDDGMYFGWDESFPYMCVESSGYWRFLVPCCDDGILKWKLNPEKAAVGIGEVLKCKQPIYDLSYLPGNYLEISSSASVGNAHVVFKIGVDMR